MTDQTLTNTQLMIYGCGKMGGAMLQGWLGSGLKPENVTVIDPNAHGSVARLGVRMNKAPKTAPDVVVVAVKPQMAAQVLPQIAPFAGKDTMVLSVMAGIPLSTLAEPFAYTNPIVRAMPNTPAAVGAGITALVGNRWVLGSQKRLAETLLEAVGQSVWLDDESQMDAVTGVSGSGPAYVFYMVEALTEAGKAQGLPEALAAKLARATVAGSGALLARDPQDAATLRKNVTSPNGTTQAGLEVLMAPEAGLAPLMQKTVAAAAKRSKELSNG